ncbi:uncharacterized protein LOC112906350 isoform X2 [Agrilus planipennis]|uniref:Uncharacterized protein LOC112906350 isoform X1 n=1 Tax=Agrilus planipennis TaxID=224129 RepID=A0A7F5RJN9_AGRPL|nr:uncharacterized protein LOC112906350 isoform X1 [Agrilus planipennis]XP_025836085.1 uncharacterized protein LOC112906350 isoform X2 [Agrilus planipennis]
MESAKFSPRGRSNKKLVCSVKGCNSTSNRDLELCFHYFPIKTDCFIYIKNIFGKLEKKKKLECWMKAIGVNKVNSGMKICSRHFYMDDYILPNAPAKLKRLKKSAVPSLNLPHSTNEKSKHDRKVRVLKRNIKKSNVTEKLQQVELMNCHQSVVDEDISESVQDVSDVIINSEQNAPTYSEKCKKSSSTKDFGVQVETVFLKSNLLNLLKNDAQLSAFTGIESFAILNTLVEIVTLKFGNQLNHHNVKMSIRDKVVMTYVKLKQNTPYNCLAILFDCCSENTCHRVFLDMIKVLSLCQRNY